MNRYQRIPLGGPVDLDGKPHGIDDGSLRKQQNIIPDKDGFPGRRGGLSYFADLYHTNDASNIVAANIHVADDQGLLTTIESQNNPVWCAAPEDFPSAVACLTSDGSRSDLYVALMDSIGVSTNVRKVASSSLPCMFSSGGQTYFVFGQTPRLGVGLRIIKAPNACGFTLEDFSFSDAQTLPTQPRYATPWRKRFLYANFEGDYRGTVIVSDIDNPLLVGPNALTDAGIEVTGAKEITGVHEVLAAGRGSPVSSIVLVMTKEHSFYLSGDPPQTVDTFDPSAPFGTLQQNKLSSSAGCLSHHSIVDTPYGTIWCGPTDVWFLPAGDMVPIPIGRRLKPLLKAQPEAQHYRIHAAYSNGFYRLALFSDGQGPDDVAPLGEQWWLDLRNSPPTSWKDAMWHGPMVFKVASSISGERGADETVTGTHYMAVDNREGQDGRLFGAHHGTVRGSVQELSLVVYDSQDPRDVGGLNRTVLVPWQSGQSYDIGSEVVVPDVVDDAGALGRVAIWRVTGVVGDSTSGANEPAWATAATPIGDNNVTWTEYGKAISPSQMKGSEIYAIVESKDYSFNDLMSDKLFQGVELSYFLTMGERLGVTLLVDGGKTVDALVADCAQSAGPLIGSGILGADRLSEEFLSLSVLSTGDTRTLGKRAQIRIEETPGILLPDGFRTVGVVNTSAAQSINGMEYTAQLADGWYATLQDLLQAVLNAIPGAVNKVGNLFPAFPELASLNNQITLADSGGIPFAPSIATAEIRYIWSLLGFTSWNKGANIPATTIVSDDIPFDLSIGDLAFEETNLKYQPFRRRPNT